MDKDAFFIFIALENSVVQQAILLWIPRTLRTILCTYLCRAVCDTRSPATGADGDVHYLLRYHRATPVTRCPPSAWYCRAPSLSLGLYAALEVAITSLACHAQRAYPQWDRQMGCAPRGLDPCLENDEMFAAVASVMTSMAFMGERV